MTKTILSNGQVAIQLNEWSAIEIYTRTATGLEMFQGYAGTPAISDRVSRSAHYAMKAIRADLDGCNPECRAQYHRDMLAQG